MLAWEKLPFSQPLAKAWILGDFFARLDLWVVLLGVLCCLGGRKLMTQINRLSLKLFPWQCSDDASV